MVSSVSFTVQTYLAFLGLRVDILDPDSLENMLEAAESLHELWRGTSRATGSDYHPVRGGTMGESLEYKLRP
jgi:hypothetical protein